MKRQSTRVMSQFSFSIPPASYLPERVIASSAPFKPQLMKTLAQLSLRVLLVVTLLNFSPSFSSAATAAKDACTLLSSADAEMAIGEPVGPPRAENRSFGSSDGTSCKYRSMTGGALKAKAVSLSVHSSATDMTGSINGITQNLKSSGFSNVQSVSGIGAAAVWGTHSFLGKPQGELTVIAGKTVMLVILIDGVPDEAAALAHAKAAAAKAIGRL